MAEPRHPVTANTPPRLRVAGHAAHRPTRRPSRSSTGPPPGSELVEVGGDGESIRLLRRPRAGHRGRARAGHQRRGCAPPDPRHARAAGVAAQLDERLCRRSASASRTATCAVWRWRHRRGRLAVAAARAPGRPQRVRPAAFGIGNGVVDTKVITAGGSTCTRLHRDGGGLPGGRRSCAWTASTPTPTATTSPLLIAKLRRIPEDHGSASILSLSCPPWARAVADPRPARTAWAWRTDRHQRAARHRARHYEREDQVRQRRGHAPSSASSRTPLVCEVHRLLPSRCPACCRFDKDAENGRGLHVVSAD